MLRNWLVYIQWEKLLGRTRSSLQLPATAARFRNFILPSHFIVVICRLSCSLNNDNIMRCAVLITCLLLPFVSSGGDSPGDGCSSGGIDLACTTLECQADRLIKAMDTSVNPCHDFYKYVCGNWAHNYKAVLNDDKNFWSTLDLIETQSFVDIINVLVNRQPNDPEPVKQANHFYAACKNKTQRNEIGLQPLVNFLNETTGGWSKAGLKGEKEMTWENLLGYVTKNYRTGVLLNIGNRPDKNNASINRIYIDQPDFILTQEEMMDPQNVEAYKELIQKVAEEINKACKGNKCETAVSNDEIKTDVENLWTFEKELVKLTSNDRTNIKRMYNPMSLVQLQMMTSTTNPDIKWADILKDIYSEAGITIKDNETVVVVEKEYVKNLAALLKNTNKNTIKNYVIWRIVYQLAGATNEAMRELLSNFEKATKRISEPTILDNTCIRETIHYFGYVINYKWLQSNHESLHETKETVNKMMRNLINAFNSLVLTADWIDKSTVEQAFLKIDNMIENIGYPDELLISDNLKKHYSDLTVDVNDFFASYQRANIFVNKNHFKMLRNSTHRRHWPALPLTAKAFYDWSRNSITFPSALLRLPYFFENRPLALNYGAIGAAISHYMIHHFDNQGLQFDKDGNLHNWWSKNSSDEFKTRQKKFSDQYQHYLQPLGIAILNQKIGDIIADNGGVRVAFEAYRKDKKIENEWKPLPGLENLNSDALFFLSFANSMCASSSPPMEKKVIKDEFMNLYHIRVNGAFKNNQAFANAFNCEVGSNMNPKVKNILW